MKIVEELQRMRLQDPIGGAEYYSISLFSSDGKTLSYSVCGGSFCLECSSVKVIQFL